MTPEEMEVDLGARLKALRLSRNIDQATLADRAGISVRALRKLEAGDGSTLKTLLATVRALGRQEWVTTVAPAGGLLNPLTLTRQAQPRQRASNVARRRTS